MEQVRKRGLLFGLMVAAVMYALLSIAIAIMTVDTCGDEDAPKSWAQFPVPHWDCAQEDFQIRR
jgi:hypothetical protein